MASLGISNGVSAQVWSACCGLSVVSSPDAAWGVSASKLILMAVGWSQFRTGSWAENLSSSWPEAPPGFLSPWTSLRAASGHGCTWSEPAERLKPTEKPQSFYNLTSEVTSHPLGHDLVIRSRLRSPTITRGGVLPRGDHQEVGITEGWLKGCLS